MIETHQNCFKFNVYTQFTACKDNSNDT